MAVRNESVRLSLIDDFTTPMAKAAAAAALLDRNLEQLDGSTVSAGEAAKGAERKTKDYTLAMAMADEKAARLKKELREQAKATLDVGAGTTDAAKATREFNLETAIAEERSARLKKALREQAKAAVDLESGLDRSVVSIDRNDRSINQLTGRLRLFADAAAVLGPGLAPLGAGLIPVLTGVTAGIGAAAGAAGVAALAFGGMGDAFKALNDYQLEPTAENLDELNYQMEKIGPAGAEFVAYIDSLTPQLRDLQMVAREGLLPGVQEGLDDLLDRLPQVRQIVSELAVSLGDLAADAGASLGGEQWNDFFDYLDRTAAPMLSDLGRSLGNFGLGLANMLAAFDPATQDFSSGMLEMSRSFAEWSSNLDGNESFQEFLNYVREAGPMARDFTAALIDAFAGLAQAMAPVGDAVLPILTQVLEVFAAIARSEIGAPLIAGAAAFAAYSRAAKLGTAALDMFASSGTRTAAAIGGVGRAAGIAAAALAGIAIADSLQRQFEGLDMGLQGVTRSLLDLSDAGSGGKLAGDFGDVADSFDRLTDPNKAQAFQDSIYNTFGFLGSDSRVDKAKGQFEALDAALANIAVTAGTGEAEKAFEALASSMGLNADEQRELIGLLPQYEDALAGAENAVRGTDEAHARYSEAMKNHNAAIAEAREGARATAQEFVGLGDSLNDAKVSLGGWLDQMAEQAQALRDFRLNAQDAAESGLNQGLIKSLREAGPEGALRMKQLADASESEIQRANRVWREGQREIRRYTDEVGGVPAAKLDADASAALRRIKQVQDLLGNYGLTTETAKAALDDAASGRIKTVQGLVDKYGITKAEARALLDDKASGALAALQRRVNDLDGDIATVTVRTINETINKVSNSVTSFFGGALGKKPGESADGSTVPKTGLPYADRHPYLLADGEEVISNRHGQADRWRPLLKAINYGRLAEGGTAGTASIAFSGWGAQGGRRTTPDAAALIDHLHKSARGLKGLTSALEKSEKIVDKERKQRQDLVSQRDEISGRVTDSLRSDIWETSGNAWSGAAADPLSALRNDIREAREHDKLRKQLMRKGLDGSALDEVMSDIDRARLINQGGRKQVDEFERLYNRRERLTSAAGVATGVAVMGPELREQTRELRQANRELKQLQAAVKAGQREAKKNSEKNAKDVTKGVNGAGTKGKRSQRRDR